MAENEIIVEDVQTESKLSRALAWLKERGRKFIVGLKRKPQNIAFLFLIVACVYFLFIMFPISQAGNAANDFTQTEQMGICFFITTLLSVLSLASFLNAFPKRKKPSVFFIALVYAMIAGMLATDIVYYIQMENALQWLRDTNATEGVTYTTVIAGQPYMIGHMVLLCVAALVLALLPVYKRLINKIDTSVHLESAAEHMTTLDIEDDN